MASSGCCSNAQLKSVVSEVFDIDDLSCGCAVCTCGSKNEDLSHGKIAKRPKRSTFPEVLYDYLKENKPLKYGVKWIQHGGTFIVINNEKKKVLQPTATVLDCIEVDWDILLTAHKSVKTKQNLVKSFTNWKFVKIKEKPELWFCDQLDANGRSLFRPDNPQLTKLIKITNDNNQVNPSFGFQNKKTQTPSSSKNLNDHHSLKDIYRPLIDAKLGENTIESIIWYKSLELGFSETSNEILLSSFVKTANMILAQRGIQFNESDLYLFIGKPLANSDDKIVTLDSLVKFVRNFGPWTSILNKMQHFLQDGARDWYHGSLSDQEATHILTSSPIGSYLVRNYPTDDAHFAINYISNNSSVRTIFITRTQNNDYHFNLEQNQILSAPTITTLLDACKDILKYPIKKDSDGLSHIKSQQMPLVISSSLPLSPLSSTDLTPPQSPFLSTLPPIFPNSSIPNSPILALGIPSTPRIDSQEFKSEYLVIRVRLIDDEFYKEIRFSTPQIDYNQLKEAISRKLSLKTESIKHIVKNGNVLVDEDNVDFLLQNQELIVHVTK